MSLKFTCPVCGINLIVQFLKPGEKAKCRNCGAFVEVPADAEYVSWESSIIKQATIEPAPTAPPAEAIVPTFVQAFKVCWKTIKANIDVTTGVAAIYLISIVAISILKMFIFNLWGHGPVTTIINYSIFGLILLFLYAGISKISLRYVFGHKAKIKDFIPSLKQYIRFLAGSLLYALIIAIGLALLIVPGIILAIKFQFYHFYILRYHLGVIESFRQSSRLTKGHRLDLLGFNFAVFFFVAAGLLFCIIVVHFAAAISLMITAYAFSRLIKDKKYERQYLDVPGMESISSDLIAESAESPGAYPTIGQAVRLILLFMMLELVFFVPVGFFEEITGSAWLDSIALEATLQLIIMALIIMYVIKKTDLQVKDVIPLKAFNLWSLIPISIATLGIMIVSSEMDNILRLILPPPDWFVEKFKIFDSNIFNFVFFILLVAPVTEEILFRGIIVRGFEKNYTRRTAVVVSAVLFGLAHLNPWQLLPAAIGGLLLAWVYLETKSLWPCIYAHAFYNGFPDLMAKLISKNIDGFTTESSRIAVFQPWWFDLTGIALLVAGIFWLNAMFKKNKPISDNVIPLSV